MNQNMASGKAPQPRKPKRGNAPKADTTQLTPSKEDIMKALEEWKSDILEQVAQKMPHDFTDHLDTMKPVIKMSEDHTDFNTAMLGAVLELEKIMVDKGLQGAILEVESEEVTDSDEVITEESETNSNTARSETSLHIGTSSNGTTCVSAVSFADRGRQLEELAGFPELSDDPDIPRSPSVPYNKDSKMESRTWLEKKSLFRYSSTSSRDKKATTRIDENKRQTVNFYSPFDRPSSDRPISKTRSVLETWGAYETVELDPIKKSLQEEVYGDPAVDWADLELKTSFLGLDAGVKGLVACMWKYVRRHVTKWRKLYFLTKRNVILSELCLKTRLPMYNNNRKEVAEAIEKIAFNHKDAHHNERYIVIGSYAGDGLANLAVYEIASEGDIWPLMFIPHLPTGLVRNIELHHGFKVRKDGDTIRYNWETYGQWGTTPAIIPATLVVYETVDIKKGIKKVKETLSGNACWDAFLTPRNYKAENDTRFMVGSPVSILALMHMADTEPLGYTTNTYTIRKRFMNSHSEANNIVSLRRCGGITNRSDRISHGGNWSRVAVSIYEKQDKLSELCAWGFSVAGTQ